MSQTYSNENFLPSVKKLRELGHDVLTSLEAGNANQRISDEDVLAFAIAEKIALLTLNRRHFAALHRANPDHFGIIICTENNDFELVADRIHSEIEALNGTLDGQLIRIYRPNLG